VKHQKRLKRRKPFLFFRLILCVSKLITSGASKLRVFPLGDGLEKTFWAHVNQDPLDFHFFIYDWTFKHAQTRIFMALDEVAGLMVVYRGCLVQVRGTREAVSLLLEELDVEGVTVQAPLDCEDIVSAKFAVAEQKGMVNLLSLKKGEENLKVTAKLEKLGVADADEIAELMHEAYPEFWSIFTAEDVADGFEEAFWVGVRREARLVAFGKAVPTPIVGHVAWIATVEGYRNRGYATSVLSTLLKKLLASSSTAIIYVLGNNPTAMHVYSKVGFKLYKRYFYVKT
jgi:ribosomal protein S18 acetylase RimI-like enzyme